MLPEELLCARGEQYEFGEVVIKVRQILNLLLVKIGRDIRAISFQGTPLSFGTHCNLLDYSFYHQREIRAGRNISFHLNLLVDNLILLLLDFDAVPTRY